jgi:ribonuclease HII
MLIAGTDEVGYGALAGPIVAVTVALEVPSIDWWPLLQVDDSKKLTESRREELRTLLPEWLIRHEGEVGIGIAQVPYINTKGYSMALETALRTQGGRQSLCRGCC